MSGLWCANGEVEVTDSRRLAVIKFTPQLLCILGHGIYEVTRNPIADGFKIRGSYYDGNSDTFCIIVEHENFDPVSVGQEIPVLLPPTVKTLRSYDDHNNVP